LSYRARQHARCWWLVKDQRLQPRHASTQPFQPHLLAGR
jgi:hypothetical protein